MNVDTPFQSPIVLSFCPGMLGLERGIERALGPIRTAAYVEIETFIVWNLLKKMEQGVLAPTPIHTNIKTFDGKPFRGKIHGITGGYPCQPFSVAGKQLGSDDPRHLWPYIAKLIRTISPVWCFFENVPGHIALGYETVRAQLQEMGYNVKEGIYSASEAGAPHKRERLFILAIRSGVALGHAEGGRTGILQNTIGEGEGYGIAGTGRILTREWRGPLAHASRIRIQGNWSEGKQEPKIQAGQKISRCHSRRNKWPAYPREEQCEWEAPRLEPSLGFTVNGYNFREDLLRMAGNGVVEQTAEIAFIDLLNKHMKNGTT